MGGSAYASLDSATDSVEVYDPALNTWSAVASMPFRSEALAACVVGNMIYAFGGDYMNGQVLQSVAAYDPATDQWTQKSDMTYARSQFAATEANGLCYAFGGIHPGYTASAEAYTP
jgi:N-acetylneuraminic acid mutarotase